MKSIGKKSSSIKIEPILTPEAFNIMVTKFDLTLLIDSVITLEEKKEELFSKPKPTAKNKIEVDEDILVQRVSMVVKIVNFKLQNQEVPQDADNFQALYNKVKNEVLQDEFRKLFSSTYIRKRIGDEAFANFHLLEEKDEILNIHSGRRIEKGGLRDSARKRWKEIIEEKIFLELLENKAMSSEVVRQLMQKTLQKEISILHHSRDEGGSATASIEQVHPSHAAKSSGEGVSDAGGCFESTLRKCVRNKTETSVSAMNVIPDQSSVKASDGEQVLLYIHTQVGFLMLYFKPIYQSAIDSGDKVSFVLTEINLIN